MKSKFRVKYQMKLVSYLT